MYKATKIKINLKVFLTLKIIETIRIYFQSFEQSYESKSQN